MHLVGGTSLQFPFHTVMFLIELIVGIVLNIVTFVIWVCGRKSKVMCCATYFAANSVVDCLGLSIAGVWIYIYSFNENIFNTDIKCKVFIYLRATFLEWSNWISAVITVERTLTVVLPLFFRSQDMRKRSKYILIVIWAVFLVANIIFLYSVGKCKDRNACCGVTDINMDTVVAVVASISALCPYLIIVTFNLATIIALCKSKLERRNTVSTYHRSYINSFTKLTVITGIAFVLANFLDLVRGVFIVMGRNFSESVERRFEILLDWSNVYYLYPVLNPIMSIAICKSVREDFTSSVQLIWRYFSCGQSKCVCHTVERALGINNRDRSVQNGQTINSQGVSFDPSTELNGHARFPRNISNTTQNISLCPEPVSHM